MKRKRGNLRFTLGGRVQLHVSYTWGVGKGTATRKLHVGDEEGYGYTFAILVQVLLFVHQG